MKTFRKKIETVPKRALLLSFKQTMHRKKDALFKPFLGLHRCGFKESKKKTILLFCKGTRSIKQVNTVTKPFILFFVYFNKISSLSLFLFAAIFCSLGYELQHQSTKEMGDSLMDL